MKPSLQSWSLLNVLRKMSMDKNKSVKNNQSVNDLSSKEYLKNVSTFSYI